MGQLAPKDILIYQKGSDPPIFSTQEELTKEAPWRDRWKIRILYQDKSLEAGEYLLTLIKSSYQIPTNLEEVEKYTVGNNLMREDMAKLWSTKNLWERDYM